MSALGSAFEVVMDGQKPASGSDVARS